MGQEARSTVVATERLAIVERLLLEVLPSDDGVQLCRDYASVTLMDTRLVGETKVHQRDADLLATALHKSLSKLADDMKNEALALLAKGHKPAPDAKLFPETVVDGVMWGNTVFVRHLATTGKRGAELSQKIPDKLLDQVIEHGLNFNHWANWLTSHRGSAYIRILAACLWLDQVQYESPRGIELVPIENAQILEHGQYPKHTAGIAWALGGQGIETEIEVDGDGYAYEPGIAAAILMPVSKPLLKVAELKKPHQEILPVEIQQETSLAVAVANATQGGVLSPIAAKIGLIVLGSPTAQAGKHLSATVGQLAKMAYPYAKRIQQRELREVGSAANELRDVFFFPPPNKRIPLFDVAQGIRHIDQVRASDVIVWGLHPMYLYTFGELIAGKGSGPHNGYFLLNLSGVLGLTVKQASAMRLLVRSSAQWNASYHFKSEEYDRDRVPWISLDEMAAQANVYPLEVVSYLEATGQPRPDKRRRLSDAREAVREDFQILEDAGLAIGEIRGKAGGTECRLLAPKSWVEARKKARSSMPSARSRLLIPPRSRSR
jgi:hypothetical protein